MNANTDTDGLLKALQKMDETGRGLFVEYLPTDKVKNVLLLLLRERDAMPALQNQLLPHVSQATRPLFLQQPLAVCPKRVGSAAAPNDNKRTKTDADLTQDTSESSAQVVVKKEQETIDIASDIEEAEAETNGQREADEAPKPLDMLMYLHVLDKSGQVTLKNFGDLSLFVQTELKRRFEGTWAMSTTRTQRYAMFTLTPERYMAEPFCIRNLVIGTRRSDKRRYIQGDDELKERADYGCIDARKPCAHFIRYQGRCVILLVPLPEALRRSMDWREIGYWVL